MKTLILDTFFKTFTKQYIIYNNVNYGYFIGIIIECKMLKLKCCLD